MIKWIRARLYHGYGDERITAHLFECGKKELMIKKLKKGSYPPFDCLEITIDEATQLRDWLNDVINTKDNSTDEHRSI
jgi:hypothetical protein